MYCNELGRIFVPMWFNDALIHIVVLTLVDIDSAFKINAPAVCSILSSKFKVVGIYV